MRLIAIAGLLLAAACREDQSALDPRGPQAVAIAHLAWILFGGGTAILAIVGLATWLAVRGSAGMRAMLARQPSIVWGGIVFPAATLTLLLGYGVWVMRAEVRAFDRPADHRIAVSGEQWWWRVTYTDAAGREIAAANEIRMPVGRDVEFTLTSPDVIHSFWIPSLGGKMDMIPGRTNRLRLRADHAGHYRGPCAEYCGGPHAMMTLTVIAMPPAAFDAWLESEAGDAIPPADPALARGKALFEAAGCGSCHAVRGTPAAGRIGPDLTHLGGRTSVGLDTLGMSPANIARFIRNGQHLKPGNRMPAFDVFAGDERAALADYLFSLR